MGDTITIVREPDGSHRLVEEVVPEHVAFSAELVALLRAGGSPWARVEPDGAHGVIVMDLTDRVLRYRLTGEVDLTDGLVAALLPEGEK